MERKAELRLPTVAVPVKLTLVGSRAPAFAGSLHVGRPAISAELFVPDASRTSRTQLLDDMAAMLDQVTSFVPVRTNAVRLLAKQAIAWIAVSRHDDEEVDFDDSPSEVITLYDRQHRVEVELIAGGTLAGTFFDSSPADRPRVVDHLNRAARFLRLWTPDDHYLINKDQILQVSEQE